MDNPLPKLVTFDGEARSGKGTIVSLVKDHLRDIRHHKVMLIDAGQVFRVLVVAMTEQGVDLDDAAAMDQYLSNPDNERHAVARVKAVYHMTKSEREALLYTPEIGVNSAKVGGRPLSQAFKDKLVRKWLRDARVEGFDIVLLDGRALDEVGSMLEREGLCQYVLGMFFVCDPRVSAQRTLGLMPKPYDELDDTTRESVDQLIAQIESRNQADRERTVHPVIPPAHASRYLVSELPSVLPPTNGHPSVIVDRSIELPFATMAEPVIRLIEHYVGHGTREH